MSLTIEKKQHNHCCELILSGAGLTENDFAVLYDAVDAEIENGQPHLILNLESLDLLNSIGITALIKNFTKCRNNGGDMYIVNISEKINQVLLLTKLNTVLNIANSTAEAVAFLNKNTTSPHS